MKKGAIQHISEHLNALGMGLGGSATVFVLIWSILRWHPNGGMNLAISLFIATFVGPILWYNLLKTLVWLLFKKEFNEYIPPSLLLGALTLLIPIVTVYKLSSMEIFMLLGVSFSGSFLSHWIINWDVSD